MLLSSFGPPIDWYSTIVYYKIFSMITIPKVILTKIQMILWVLTKSLSVQVIKMI